MEEERSYLHDPLTYHIYIRLVFLSSLGAIQDDCWLSTSPTQFLSGLIERKT